MMPINILSACRGVFFFLTITGSFLAVAGDEQAMQAAREAYHRKDGASLARVVAQVTDSQFQPWLEYWSLSLRLDELPSEAVRAYLMRNADTWMADRLRADWLRRVAKFGDWQTFDSEIPTVSNPDQELSCYSMRSRYEKGDKSVLAKVRPIWAESLDIAPACSTLVDAAFNIGELGMEDAWQRIRRLGIAGRSSTAKSVASYLPAESAPEAKSLDAAAGKSERYLDRLEPGFGASRAGRELVLIALARVAKDDPDRAASLVQRLGSELRPEDLAVIYAHLGWQGAQRHLREALRWYEAAGEAALTDDQHAWKARAALRAGQWASLRKAIEAMPERLAARPEWVYWLGRALDAEGKRETARMLWQKVAGEPHFYGNLADEELGRPVTLPSIRAAVGEADVARVLALTGIRRSLALFRADLRNEAVLDWNWALRKADDRTLLAAAELARREGLYDRAIHAAERTRDEHDYALRFLTPYREQVESKTRQQALDQAWVYGLMRQESRFVTSARSSAGASGLMQLMPDTARWVARKIGLSDYRPRQVNDVDTNLMLGTTYLKLMMEKLDNHPVLAVAAYNAGPNRAKRWRDVTPLEGAVFAETIPFAETRDYVKKVMSNTMYYASVLEHHPQSLKSRLGVVAPAAPE